MDRIVLYASEGKILTDGKTYGKVIFLAVGESADTYTEITEADFLQIVENGTSFDDADYD